MDILKQLLFPIIFPFKQYEFFKKMWWIPIIAMIPILNTVVLSGWRKDMIYRIGRYDSFQLPESESIINLAIEGVLLHLLMIPYFVIPFSLIAYVSQEEYFNIFAFLQYTINPEQGVYFIYEIVPTNFLDWLTKHRFQLAWFAFAFPCFRIALIRSAKRQTWEAFLDVKTNLILLMKHSAYFFVFAISFIITMIILLAIGKTIYLVNQLFWLVPLITIPIYYWTTGYNYGMFAQELYD